MIKVIKVLRINQYFQLAQIDLNNLKMVLIKQRNNKIKVNKISIFLIKIKQKKFKGNLKLVKQNKMMTHIQLMMKSYLQMLKICSKNVHLLNIYMKEQQLYYKIKMKQIHHK